MRLGILVNDITTEKDYYATTDLAFAAVKRGHEVYYLDVEAFDWNPEDTLQVRARKAPEKKGKVSTWFKALQTSEQEWERFPVNELDILFLRNNPADDAVERPWATDVNVIFGIAAKRAGVLVLNDPHGLVEAKSKLYLQAFPVEVRPVSEITRDVESIKAFVEERGRAIIKPVSGSGGNGVFLIEGTSKANFGQIVETVSKHGYVVVQEYLPAAAKGDVRLFMMNGEPLEVDGSYAAILRKGQDDDVRNNITAGGSVKKAKITDRMLELCRLIRPRLVADGMFLVGVDIAGDKLLEINVYSPGGLHQAIALEEKDFAGAIIEALESKLATRDQQPGRLENALLATL